MTTDGVDCLYARILQYQVDEPAIPDKSAILQIVQYERS